MKTTTYNKNERLTNEQIASLIGRTHSAVSRLRSGDRKPGVQTMFAVEAAFGWPAADQLQVRMLGDNAWAHKFEAVLDEYTTAPR
jgi:hypothetical protein